MKTSEQAMRDNAMKPRLSFMLDFPNAMEEVSKVMQMGAEKYETNNWKKGLNIRSVEDSLLRHLVSFHNGEDLDKESGFHHMAHIICNACFIIEHQKQHGKKVDDR